MKRGTSNSNSRGSSYDRRARREFLMKKFGNGKTVPCFWCGRRLRKHFEVDRWPVCGHDGGSYRRNNIVPACSDCNGKRCTSAKKCRASVHHRAKVLELTVHHQVEE